jgi:putative ABC transport system substrate-binding protein
MKRREFVTLLGGAAAGWPLAARAQQVAMPVIGLLHPLSPGAYADNLRAFQRGLKESGYIEGENVTIVYRWAEGHTDQLRALADELVRRQVSMIAAFGPAAFAARAATATIPIVFLVNVDPVRLGLAASPARPGGNLTGINFANLTGINFPTTELAGRRLELLRELPVTTRVAVLVNPADTVSAETTVEEVEGVARTMGLQIQVLKASTSGEINAAFATFVRDRPDALFVDFDPFFINRRVQIVSLAARHAIPASYSGRQFTEVGGLTSYGRDLTDAWRQVGVYAGRILKGAKPADLPVVQASKFEFVINVETARMLDLTVPPTLLARADEVIE